MSEKTRVLAIAGPTASGKSALSIRLCHAFGGELISCDSMQIYRGMDVGTAKPSAAERAEVPHHMLDICAPDEEYSVADFAAGARICIEEITARGHLPVLCGGTGLYLNAILDGTQFGELCADESYRASLSAFAEAEGAEALHQKLRALDPEAADAIHPNNVRRVIRALEICHASGMTKTAWDDAALPRESPYDSLLLALDYRDRDTLYARIEKRVDAMFDAGLEAEVRALAESGCLTPDSTAGGAIGYKEFFAYLRGEATIDETKEAIVVATRHYAKRQLTWLRRRQDVIWLYPDDYPNADGLFKAAEALIKEHF